jgi:hypothetical protein
LRFVIVGGSTLRSGPPGELGRPALFPLGGDTVPVKSKTPFGGFTTIFTGGVVPPFGGFVFLFFRIEGLTCNIGCPDFIAVTGNIIF